MATAVRILIASSVALPVCVSQLTWSGAATASVFLNSLFREEIVGR